MKYPTTIQAWCECGWVGELDLLAGWTIKDKKCPKCREFGKLHRIMPRR